ncbi:hypothetical protein LOAG_02208 [Loa loa]|uniref:Uncharacterized protein n=1 Tax=Loa loa TaxID=7209 RepID=A0A1S0U7R2_LOALO|nr:hypothetical protein LOAG_02208 [Loa loa]EFO26288.1 hypothetical protein LOAG_02208 [Loa loa]
MSSFPFPSEVSAVPPEKSIQDDQHAKMSLLSSLDLLVPFAQQKNSNTERTTASANAHIYVYQCPKEIPMVVRIQNTQNSAQFLKMCQRNYVGNKEFQRQRLIPKTNRESLKKTLHSSSVKKTSYTTLQIPTLQ